MGNDEFVTLTLDDDEEVNCSVLGIFEAANGKEYIALLQDKVDADVYLYRYRETGEEEPVLEEIMDDEEFEIASKAFDEMLDSMNLEV